MRKAAVVLVMLGLASSAAMATPYASGITDLGGGMYAFILNQYADNVTIDRWGDTPLDMGALAAGTHSFDIGAGTGFSIAVTSYNDEGWTQYIADQELTNFWNPGGVSVNTDPAHANFGKLYVSESNGGTTGNGRVVTSGIYMLNADASDAGWADGGVDWTAQGTLAPWKSTLDADGNLYVADFSNDLAFGFNADLSVATQLVDATNKTEGQYINSLWVEGTQAGGDRVVYLVNGHYADARRGLIKYDFGTGDTAVADDTGTQWIGPDYFDFYPRDVVRDSGGDWYMNQFRYDPDQAPAITRFDGDGTIPLGDDPAEVVWETDISAYTGAYNVGIDEDAGIAAYGHYYNGNIYIFDITTGAYIEEFNAGGRIRDLCFDAAGNLITGDSSTEQVRHWSPGGDWIATTTSDGTFTLVPTSAPCPGDLDGDLDVDLADLAQLLSNYGVTSGAVYEDGDLDGDGDVDLSDLAALLAVYGTTC